VLADENAVEGDWLVALKQAAGKGRQGRQWVSAKGNFYGSTLVVLEAGDPPPQTLSLAAGLALIEAVGHAAPDRALMLKWPNDLMLAGKKLGGILLERSGDRIAVGVGVNLAASPHLPDREAANLGGAISPQAFAPLIAGGFARLLALWRTSESSALVRAWQERAHLPGTRLTVHVTRDETLGGRFAGLEPDGALRLMLDDGSIEVVRAGDISLS
jgi:BirA family transcriptional regulator, biotin operon repressor / biotin---[acetyl-CoA-carboxylase] ligase